MNIYFTDMIPGCGIPSHFIPNAREILTQFVLHVKKILEAKKLRREEEKGVMGFPGEVLFPSSFNVGSIQAELSKVQSEFFETQAELSETQAELSETQAELSEVQSELRKVQPEFHKVRSESRNIQAEL